jgi:Uma2 family endonuclease
VKSPLVAKDAGRDKEVVGDLRTALSPAETEGFWPISPDVAIEVKSDTDKFADTLAKVGRFVKRGTQYAVAIDPTTREVVEIGTRPDGLELDFDAIIEA